MDTYNKAAKGGAALENTLYMFENVAFAIRGPMAKLAGPDVPEGMLEPRS